MKKNSKIRKGIAKGLYIAYGRNLFISS